MAIYPRTYIKNDVNLKIHRFVNGTDSRQLIEETVDEALRMEPAGNDFSTCNGTVHVSARLADDAETQILYDPEKNKCFYYNY